MNPVAKRILAEIFGVPAPVPSREHSLAQRIRAEILGTSLPAPKSPILVSAPDEPLVGEQAFRAERPQAERQKEGEEGRLAESAIAALEGVLARLKATDSPTRLTLRPYVEGGALLSGSARDLVSALDRTLELDRDLVGSLHFDRDLVRDLASDLVRARALASDLARDLDRACVLARDHDYKIAIKATEAIQDSHNLNEALGQVHRLTAALEALAEFSGMESHLRATEKASRILDEMEEACSVFYDTDLGGADLTGVDLEGVRWSAGTRWPSEYEEEIRRDSHMIAPGMYEIRRGRRIESPSGLNV